MLKRGDHVTVVLPNGVVVEDEARTVGFVTFTVHKSTVLRGAPVFFALDQEGITWLRGWHVSDPLAKEQLDAMRATVVLQ